MAKTGITIDQRIDRAAYNRAHYQLRREEILAQKRVYRRENRERVREYGRQHYWSNRDYYLAYSKKYVKVNPQKAIEYVARRRARKYGSKLYQIIDRRLVFTRDKGICWLCKLPVEEKWELDHIVPLSKGGEHNYTNVAVAHRSCNAKKSARLIDEKVVMPMPVEMIGSTAV